MDCLDGVYNRKTWALGRLCWALWALHQLTLGVSHPSSICLNSGRSSVYLTGCRQHALTVMMKVVSGPGNLLLFCPSCPSLREPQPLGALGQEAPQASATWTTPSFLTSWLSPSGAGNEDNLPYVRLAVL